jgi:hypothetical protein
VPDTIQIVRPIIPVREEEKKKKEKKKRINQYEK